MEGGREVCGKTSVVYVIIQSSGGKNHNLTRPVGDELV